MAKRKANGEDSRKPRRRSRRSKSAIASRSRRPCGRTSAIRARRSCGRCASTRSTRRSPIGLAASATVNVPYEKLEPGPIGSLFDVNSTGAPEAAPGGGRSISTIRCCCFRAASSPTPSNGRFHLQMVYAVCSLTYAAFRRALGRDIAWATPRRQTGPLRLVVQAVRLSSVATPATAAKAATSRSATSTPARNPRASR